MDGKPDAANAMFENGLKIYPFKDRKNPPKMKFISGSEIPFNTIHANDFTFVVEQWSAGIALVDRCVRLNEVVKRPAVDVARCRRHDAGRDRATQTEGVTHGEHFVACAHFVRVAEGDGGEVFSGLDPQQRYVGQRVTADHRRFQFTSIGQFDQHLFGAVDHVMIGHDFAVLTDDEP